MKNFTEKPEMAIEPITMMQAKRLAVRHARQAQGALERGHWLGAYDHLEAAKSHVEYCRCLDWGSECKPSKPRTE